MRVHERADVQNKREIALAAAYARGKVEKGIRTDTEVAESLGWDQSRFSQSKKRNFQTMRLEDFGKLARIVGLTGREVCRGLGVPYEDPKD